MMHLLLHAAGNMRARALRLIQLHDIARLAQAFGSGDWKELLAARPDGSHAMVGAGALMSDRALLSRGQFPPDVLASLKQRVPLVVAQARAAPATGGCLLVEYSHRGVSGVGMVADSAGCGRIHEKQNLAEP